MNKRGFTLLELVVYMAMIGIVVLVAGEAFSNSTRFRVRSQNMLKAAQLAENVGVLFKDDVSQLGAKSSKELSLGATADTFFVERENIYIHPDDATRPDSSSFVIVKDFNGVAGNDSLGLLRMRYREDGTYGAVEKIGWYVKNGVLKRSCQTISGVEDPENCPLDEPLTVEMAENVDLFTVLPAKPQADLANSRILPSSDTSEKAFRLIPRFGDDNFAYLQATPSSGGTSVGLSGFASNYDFELQKPTNDGKNANQVFLATANSNAGNWKSLCKKISLESGVEYEISFSMPYSEDASRMFCPGRDHMSVGFRYVNDASRPAELNDFLFYPPTLEGAAEGLRSMRFSVKDSIRDVCLAFTFASYSPVAATGTVFLSEVQLRKVESANYQFDESININESDAQYVRNKQNVKALRWHLVVNQNGETGQVTSVVPIPSNGPRD